MMVDPMLMIVQSLRSFLTAVTTTAVAPIAVIITFVYLNIPKCLNIEKLLNFTK